MILAKYLECRQKGKKLNLKEKAYHVTFERNLPSILKLGLRPDKKEKLFDWCGNRVYMASSRSGCYECIGHWFLDQREKGITVNEKLVLIQIELSMLDEKKLKCGEAFEMWEDPTNHRVLEWVYADIIPVHAIKIIPCNIRFNNKEMNKAFNIPTKII